MKDMLYAPVLEHVMVPKGTYDLIVEFSDSHSGHRTYIPDAKFVNYNESFATMEQFIRDAIVAINQRGYSNNDISVATQKFIMESANLWPTESIYHNRILKFMESAYRVPEKAKDLRNELVAEYPYLSDAITYMTRKYLEQYMTHIDQEMAFLESYISGNKYLPLQESADYDFHGYYMPEGLGDQIASIPGKIIVLIKKLLNSLSLSLSEAGKKFSNRILANNQVNEQAIQQMYKLFQAKAASKNQLPIRYPNPDSINQLRQSYSAGFQAFEDQMKDAIGKRDFSNVDKGIVKMIQSFGVVEGSLTLPSSASYQDFRRAILSIANNLILMDQFMVTLKNIDDAITNALGVDSKELNNIVNSGAAKEIRQAKDAATANKESVEVDDIRSMLFTEGGNSNNSGSNKTAVKTASVRKVSNSQSTQPVRSSKSPSSSVPKPSAQPQQSATTANPAPAESQPQPNQQSDSSAPEQEQTGSKVDGNFIQRLFHEYIPNMLNAIYDLFDGRGFDTLGKIFDTIESAGQAMNTVNGIMDNVKAGVDTFNAVRGMYASVSNDMIDGYYYSEENETQGNQQPPSNQNQSSDNAADESDEANAQKLENAGISSGADEPGMNTNMQNEGFRANIFKKIDFPGFFDAFCDKSLSGLLVTAYKISSGIKGENNATPSKEPTPAPKEAVTANKENVDFEYQPDDDSIISIMEKKEDTGFSAVTAATTGAKIGTKMLVGGLKATAKAVGALVKITPHILNAIGVAEKAKKINPNQGKFAIVQNVTKIVSTTLKLNDNVIVKAFNKIIDYGALETKEKGKGVEAAKKDKELMKVIQRIFISAAAIMAVSIIIICVVPKGDKKLAETANGKFATPRRANQNLAATKAAVPDLAKELWNKGGNQMQTLWMFINGWLYGGQTIQDPKYPKDPNKKIKTVGIAEIIKQEIECLSPYVNMNGVIQFSTEIE